MNFKVKSVAIVLFLFTVNSSIGQKVVGYIDANLNEAETRIPKIHWGKLTDFIYGFIQPDGGGNLPNPTSLSHFNTVKTYCDNNNVNLHFSSGGATASGIFSTIGASQIASDNYAMEVADLIDAYGLKGFDLDWEFPKTIAARTAQVRILKAIHDEFTSRGKRSDWEIAIAVGGETPSVGSQGVYHTDYADTAVFKYLDYLNIMAYDIGLGISGNDPNHSSYDDAVANVIDWNNKGCPMEKIILGVPFYGRHRTSRYGAAYATTYGDLSNSDPAAAYNSNNVGDYFYNGKPLLTEKTDYIMNAGGGGIMIWEVTYDRFDQYSLLDVIADAMAPYQCSAPKPDLGNDQSICGASSIILNGGITTSVGRTFTWKKGATTLVDQSYSANTYSVNSTGIYTLEVWEGGCNVSDEIEITGALNAVDLGGPYELCSPVSVTLDAAVNPNGKTIEWQKDNITISGETIAAYIATTGGTYKVIVSATGCSSVNSSAVVTSSVPYANNDTVCYSGNDATLTASETVNWYSSEVSTTILSASSVYEPTVNFNTTYWMGGTGAASTSYTTMKSAFISGWQANGQVYGNKLIVSAEISIDAVTVNSAGGNVVINLVEDDGVTVVETKTFNSISGKTELTLGWMSIQPGTYYLNTAGTTNNLWVDSEIDGSDYTISGVLVVEKSCYADWSAPYGDAYAASSNYGNFLDLKVTAGSACDRVPVDVVIDASNIACLSVGKDEIVENKFKVFPNPSSNEFTLTASTAGVVTIFDVRGAVVNVINSIAETITFGTNLKKGVYFIQLLTAKGSSVQRIIKR